MLRGVFLEQLENYRVVASQVRHHHNKDLDSGSDSTEAAQLVLLLQNSRILSLLTSNSEVVRQYVARLLNAFASLSEGQWGACLVLVFSRLSLSRCILQTKKPVFDQVALTWPAMTNC